MSPAATTNPFGGSLRPGELLIGNSESNVVPHCNDESGGLTTFSMQDFDEGAQIEPLHTFRPVNGDWIDGSAGAAGAASWVVDDDGTEYIFSTDCERGLDIIRFHRDAPRPTEAQMQTAALMVTQPNPIADAERWFCKLGAQG